ncbi:MAG TPA: Rho termination factor N-terminal domain-containing protein, partial [Actinomycetota bacterium]|nr:Rho termination factor N-terminal domain-containing protein [Actinomycetota bacterium]
MESRAVDKATLEQKVLPELQEIASGLGVEGYQRLKKGELIEAIVARSGGDGQGAADQADGGQDRAGGSDGPARAEAATETRPRPEPRPEGGHGPPRDRREGRRG